MVTINDVAAAAGVAPSTVSYVISGKRAISPKTRRLVEDTIRKLGYHPHAGARALASSKTNVLALVVPLRTDTNVAVVMEFVASAVTAARAYDHDLLLLTTDEGPAALRRVVSSAIADAVMVMDVEAADPRVPMLLTLDRPVVLIGVPDHPDGLSCVDLDFAAAGEASVAHLAGLGHRRIVLVGPGPEVYQRGTSYATRFIRGFTAEAERRDVQAATTAWPAAYQHGGGLDDLLARHPDVTGLVVHNEAALPGLLSDLRYRGVRVPEDISVVAVCPDSMAVHYPIPLTSIAIPAREVGTLAVETVMRQLAGHRTAETRLLAPKLAVRASTAPPAHR
ncbi:LacI family DNA-binding transcriptional regulator [Amycolatopsis benzoatilytica]|uniref:LacI family DNA-binding transcriptional regulator n=1 Tax=Amycolatopsis benzoatilytica TaxID=346045 RepID=UPI00035F2527|nr:LacI family DNA-binding transcriptional regulator [Amycolatopsis benzoatilytica]